MVIVMRISGALVVVALCGLICVLMLPASAGAELRTGGPPDECTFEEGEMGRYIVVFYDWAEDTEALAQEQVERYGGNLGFVYESVLKGYTAEFPPPSAQALQAEPTVNYVEVDQLIWMDESSGVIQWHSCPLAPPLGPVPPISPDLSEEPEQPKTPGDLEPSVEPNSQTTQLGASGQQGEQSKPRANRCEAKAKKGKRCGPRRGHIDRRACKKRKVAGKRPCLRIT
jgi:hypothetical protein